MSRDARQRAEAGELLFGTVDSWLIWNLTKGKVHVTDYSNASRTMLFNIQKLEWDDDILKAMNIPACMLPEARPSSEVYGDTDPPVSWAWRSRSRQPSGTSRRRCSARPASLPAWSKAHLRHRRLPADEHRERPDPIGTGLLTTIAWGLDGKVEYALEGLHLCGRRRDPVAA